MAWWLGVALWWGDDTRSAPCRRPEVAVRSADIRSDGADVKADRLEGRRGGSVLVPGTDPPFPILLTVYHRIPVRYSLV